MEEAPAVCPGALPCALPCLPPPLPLHMTQHLPQHDPQLGACKKPPQKAPKGKEKEPQRESQKEGENEREEGFFDPETGGFEKWIPSDEGWEKEDLKLVPLELGFKIDSPRNLSPRDAAFHLQTFLQKGPRVRDLVRNFENDAGLSPSGERGRNIAAPPPCDAGVGRRCDTAQGRGDQRERAPTTAPKR